MVPDTLPTPPETVPYALKGMLSGCRTCEGPLYANEKVTVTPLIGTPPKVVVVGKNGDAALIEAVGVNTQGPLLAMQLPGV